MVDEAGPPRSNQDAAQAEIERLLGEIADANRKIAEQAVALAEAENARREAAAASRRRTSASHR